MHKQKHGSMLITGFLFLFIILNSACGQRTNTPGNKDRELVSLDPFRESVADSLKYLLPLLDSVYRSDQKYRAATAPGSAISPAEHDKSIKDFKAHRNEVLETDSVNAVIVGSILDRYGWLGPKDIGFFGNMTIFLVIQHAAIAVQEKHLPALKKAVVLHKALPSSLALLEDRLSLKKEGRQVYGTQVFYSAQKKRYYIAPLIDPENVLERRASIGLDAASFQVYLKQFQLHWDIGSYTKDLPEVVKLISASGINF